MPFKRSVIAHLAATLSISLVVGAQQASTPNPDKGILEVVVADEDNKPLAGVLVAVPGHRSTTGVDGTCRFSLLLGRYSVLIRKSGYRGQRMNAGVRPGETNTLRVILQRLPSRSARK